ncbi:MAG: hypothetical protein LC800_20050 [Acidobacteria bacterium]|nr:hypothetical protein [Acidobacteriota bacterium]
MTGNRTISGAAARSLLCALLFAPAAFAQQGPARTPPQPPPPRDARGSGLRVELPTPVAETPVPFEGARGGSLQTLSFTTPDVNFERKLVKGAPFSAVATTEHVQTLGDGNRMTRKSAARLFRDSAGRTRREHTLARGGARTAPDGEAPRLIIINDPVGQVNYQLETETQTARKMFVPPGLAEARARAMGGEQSFGVLVPADVGRRRIAEGDAAPRPPAPKTEKLEAQTIEGVSAEGTRATLTIPAGEFDNEQPLEITHEQWYSAELQTVVLMRHNDPRFGETTYKLTNVTRGESDRTLFELPDGYRIVDGRGGPRDFPGRRMPPPGLPPPGRP